jgi:hypothetical protein
MDFRCVNSLPIGWRTSDAASSRSRSAAAPASTLTIAALEKRIAEEERRDLADPLDLESRPTSGPWDANERHAKLLRDLNRRNKEFWDRGGRAA